MGFLMKVFKLLFLVAIISVSGVLYMQNSSAESFSVASNTFVNGQTMPNSLIHSHFGCTGENKSPHLKWQGAPEGTKSFALIAHDPDAPRPTGWYHWIVLNIPVSVRESKAGQQINHPMMQVKNDFGSVTYGGACPPKGHGVHRYNFTVYALDCAALIPSPGSTPDSVERQVKKHALSSATITANYGRD